MVEDSKQPLIEMTYNNDGTRTIVMKGVPAGYIVLLDALLQAFSQAAYGKGKERHVVNDAGFRDQQIFSIAEHVGTGFVTGQAVKKIYESSKQFNENDNPEAALRDYLGAIVYTAAAVIICNEEIAKRGAQ